MLSSPHYKYVGSVNRTSSHQNTNITSKLSHYSPPVTRRSYLPPNASSSYSDPSPRYYGNNVNTIPRRDALSFTSPNYNDKMKCNRYDSLNRIDLLREDTLNRLDSLSVAEGYKVQRRHSVTQQEYEMRKSPKLQRRSSSSYLNDPLPSPLFKALSPVAKELRNSVAVNSARFTSDTAKRLEDRWQVGLQLVF